MKKIREKPPTGLTFGGYVHRNMTGTASGFSQSGNPPMGRNVNLNYAQQMLRLRPSNDLHLDVLGLPNTGVPHQPTTPRQRPQTQQVQSRRHTPLAYSDSHAMEAIRSSTRGSLREHARAKTVDEQLLSSVKEDKTTKNPRKLDPLPKRPPSSSVKRQLSATKAPYGTLPPLAGEVDSELKVVSKLEEALENSSESSSESEDELQDDESEAPPSRPGFESDLERSAQSFHIPFPTVNTLVPFQATLIQDHAQLESTRFMAGVGPSGISSRVDNIVRAFRIHGSLDKKLLSQALNEVASLHPLLSAVFQRCKDKLYIQVRNKGDIKVNLESPVVAHEKPEDLLLTARRKLFHLPMSNDLVATSPDSDSSDAAPTALSLISVAGSDVGEQSPTLPRGTQALRKKVSFAALEQVPLAHQQKLQTPQLPSLLHQSTSEEDAPPLMRARLISKGVHEHILVLSFPRIICDFWSSCLFAKQLADAYINLEKCASYRPSLAAMRMENKRQQVINAHEKSRTVGAMSRGGRMDASTRLMQRRAQQTKQSKVSPLHPARLHFQQVAKRESQLLLLLPKEKLWEFWESTVTATIRRQRGPNRIKLVPPVRIPKGLGDKSVSTSTARGGRPQTSRLRPLTASRNRPTTASRRSGVFVDAGASRDVLMGPMTKFHFMKVEEDVCRVFIQSFPEEQLGQIQREELLSLFSLGTFVILLGKCCRGWGTETETIARGRDTGNSGQLQSECYKPSVIPERPQPQRQAHAPDPLQKYKTVSELRRPIVVPHGSPGRRATMAGGKLDLGSFLIGVDVSLREEEPTMTQGLFAPLSNDVGIRVNLSSSPTFVDLILALGKTLKLARKHGHLPFGSVAEEVGLIHGLPIRFSFFRHHDIIQLTNQNHFYFAETAMGVEGGHGLARFGSHCYLSPINSKMNDNCHMELLLWEGYEAENMAGGLRYQPQVIKRELLEAFASELLRLMAVVAEEPRALLTDIASQVHPPFLSSRKNRTRRS